MTRNLFGTDTPTDAAGAGMTTQPVSEPIARFENERVMALGCTAASPYLQKRAQIPSRRKNKGRTTGMMWIPLLKSWYRRLEESSRRYWPLQLGNVG